MDVSESGPDRPLRGDRRRARQGARGDRDRALAALASEQFGVVTRAQLVEIGLGDAAISDRLLRGHLHALGPSVYSVGHAAVSRRARGLAALLHLGDGCGLSHISAARLWGMVDRSVDGPIHISTRTRSTRKAPTGVVVHRPRNLLIEELVRHRGLWSTTPERTVVDLLPTTSMVRVTRMLEQMVTQLDRSPDALHTWGHGLASTPGRAKLIRALDEVAGPAVIRSEFESRFRSVCQEAGVPPAKTNHKIGRWEVDAAWLEQRVAVELDSWRWHGGRWQFHRDRHKGLEINRAGFELVRISWPQLKHERQLVIDAVRQALARGSRHASDGLVRV